MRVEGIGEQISGGRGGRRSEKEVGECCGGERGEDYVADE